jgi:hypothetical protein
MSDLQRRNLVVKFCLKNPNKSKSETVEQCKLLKYKKPTIYGEIKRFDKQENMKKKLFSAKKRPFYRPKIVLP